jgi:hypothetical protein
MPCPKGYVRGPMSAEHKRKIAVGNVAGQRRRWLDPEKRARAMAGCHKSWDTGGRAKDRVVWTPKMDEALRELVTGNFWRYIHVEGPRVIGVGHRTMVERIYKLGIKSRGTWQHKSQGTRREGEAFQMVEMRRQKLSWGVIAERLGETAQCVRGMVLRRAPELGGVLGNPGVRRPRPG